MVESVFVFGNGLGRSIDNDFFSLETALRSAWQDGNILSEGQKALIQSCLPPSVLEDADQAPTSESDLEDLQRVLTACETISVFQQRQEGKDELWLTEHGLKFPVAIRQYLHKAACYYHNRVNLLFNGTSPHLPEDFCAPLRAFIVSCGAHVATLNYDDLLYEAFSKTTVFEGYHLRDGFLRGELNFARQERLQKPCEGWFLHLHGSPLFITKNGVPGKIKRAELYNYEGDASTHLVLTSVKYKRATIAASEILSAYWEKLDEIIPSAKNIVVFGYGGADVHLNDAISRAKEGTTIRVVERQSEKAGEDRLKYWKTQLRRETIQHIPMQNILEFRDWRLGD